MRKNKSEGLLGSGVVDQVFTSGATIRRLGQDFSSTNQGPYTIVHNADLKELVPGVVPSASSDVERLVNERGEPDFWEISSELDAYRSSQTAGMAADAAAQASTASSSSAAAAPAASTSEWFSPGSPADQVDTATLQTLLWH